MRFRKALSALVLGLVPILFVWALLTRYSLVARANPGIYYVRLGSTGTTCTMANPCGTVQKAIDLATAPGDEVRVARGTYIENLNIDHSIKLGGGWNDSFTVQDPTNFPTFLHGIGGHNVTIDALLDHVTVEGLTLRDGADGIHVRSGVVTVTHCTVRTYMRQGIEVEEGTVWLIDNLITGTGGEREGIEIDGGTVIVLSNTIDNVGRHGILVEGGTTLIEANVVHAIIENASEEYHGIEVTGTQIVSGNWISNVDHYGIRVRGGASTIVNNTVHDTGSDGIHANETGASVEISGNIVHDTGSDGIDARAQTSILTTNRVYTTAKDGIHVERASTATVQYNTIENVWDDGIDVGGGTVFIKGNFVHTCGESGVKAESVDHTSVVDANQVYEANQDDKENKAGINLDNAGTFTITNNIVAGTRGASVLVENGAGLHNVLHHNTLVGSATDPQGAGIDLAVTGVTMTLVNNIIVSHDTSISATTGTTLIISSTLLWGNGDDPVTGTAMLAGPPRFVAPAEQDYHLLPDSPAVDAALNIDVHIDVDGDTRPIGPHSDIGADEVRLRSFLPLMLRNS